MPYELPRVIRVRTKSDLGEEGPPKAIFLSKKTIFRSPKLISNQVGILIIENPKENIQKNQKR